MAETDQVAGETEGSVAVVTGHGVCIGLFVIKVQENHGGTGLGNFPVIGFGRLTQQDQPGYMLGGYQAGKSQVLLFFRIQDFQKAEMAQVRQLFDQPLVDFRIIGIRLKILVRNQNTDFQVLPENSPASMGVLISHFHGFFQDFQAKPVAHSRFSRHGL